MGTAYRNLLTNAPWDNFDDMICRAEAWEKYDAADGVMGFYDDKFSCVWKGFLKNCCPIKNVCDEMEAKVKGKMAGVMTALPINWWELDLCDISMENVQKMLGFVKGFPGDFTYVMPFLNTWKSFDMVK